MAENIHHGASERSDLTKVLRLAFFSLLILAFLSTLSDWIGLMGDTNRIILPLISFPTSLMAGILFLVIVSKGETVLPGVAFGGHRARWSPLKRNFADLEKARHSTVKRDSDNALQLVSEVLANAPDLPEGLYLEAQILWEGFGNGEGAKAVLLKLMKVVSKNDTLYQWALSYNAQISKM